MKHKIYLGKERMMFSTFVAIETNREAKAKAKSFLRNNQSVLVVTGPIASGKTHLAMAITNRFVELNEEPCLICSGMQFIEMMRKVIICSDGEDSFDEWLSQLFDSYNMICVDAADVLFGDKYFYQYGKSVIDYLENEQENLRSMKKKIVFALCDENPIIPGSYVHLEYPSFKELLRIYDRIACLLENNILTPEDKKKILSMGIKNIRELEGTIISVNAKRMLRLPSKKN